MSADRPGVLLSNELKTILIRLFCFLFFLAYCYAAIDMALIAEAVDLDCYLSASRDFLNGEDVYKTRHPVAALGFVEMQLYFLYPPLLFVLFTPFVSLSHEMASILWTSFNLVLLLLSCYGLVLISSFTSLKRFSKESRFYVALAATGFFAPVWFGFAYGQVHLVVLSLIVFFIYFLLIDRQGVAAFLLALAVWIKMTPVFLLLAALRFKKWRLISYFTLFILALFLFQLLCGVNFELWYSFIENSLFVTNKEDVMTSHSNFSPLAIVANLIGGKLAPVVHLMPTIVLISLTAFIFFRAATKTKLDELILLSKLIILMILFSPIVWSHHLTWALLPILLCTASLWHEGSWPQKILLALVYYVLMQAEVHILLSEAKSPASLIVSRCLPAFALFVLLGMLARLKAKKL